MAVISENSDMRAATAVLSVPDQRELHKREQ